MDMQRFKYGFYLFHICFTLTGILIILTLPFIDWGINPSFFVTLAFSLAMMILFNPVFKELWKRYYP
ncbi:putative membrane protein [Paenibacillus mucilaginosus]